MSVARIAVTEMDERAVQQSFSDAFRSKATATLLKRSYEFWSLFAV